jgi:prepilin-type N-terminal cleavage/methylation domain-containing protein
VTRNHRSHPGFTLVELAVVIAIIAVIAALGYPLLSRMRPRGELASATAELQAAIHGARLSALADGKNVVVMIFPQYAFGDSLGRVIIYEDGDFNFFSTVAGVQPTFGGYNPAVLATGPNSQILDTIDLPRGVVFGPPTGMGAGAALAAPLNLVNVTTSCSFCRAGGDGRGAMLFDTTGRLSFYNADGPPLGTVDLTQGASLSLFSTDVSGTRTLVISTATGSVRAFNNG